MIELKQISKIFQVQGRPVQALSNITLHVPKGNITGVIGTSGAGKSTLLRCVNLLERPTQGEVVIDGQVLSTLDDHALRAVRRQIGMIFQHFNLLKAQRVFDNVALPLRLAGVAPAAIQQRVEELLKVVGMSDQCNAYPSQLSGGQQQRVAIARALACRPKILLCDEATSALDPANTHAILDLLRSINHRFGLTIFLITHDMNVIKQLCEHVILLNKGQVVEQGAVSAVFTQPQTPLAQQFIDATRQHLALPQAYAARLQPQPTSHSAPVVRFIFSGHSVDAPLISEITRRFNINSNLLSAQIDHAGGVKLGVILAELSGDMQALAAATTFLQQHHVTLEVIGHVTEHTPLAS